VIIGLVVSATTNFIRWQPVLIKMARTGVPESLWVPLAIVKLAGALGLLIGVRVPLIRTTSSVGIVLFFGNPPSRTRQLRRRSVLPPARRG
jgi:hypothetical protein